MKKIVTLLVVYESEEEKDLLAIRRSIEIQLGIDEDSPGEVIDGITRVQAFHVEGDVETEEQFLDCFAWGTAIKVRVYHDKVGYDPDGRKPAGPGWYYLDVDADAEPGGPFGTKEEAIEFAKEAFTD